MKITINKKNLLEGLQIVQKAITTKSTLPVLSGILLKTKSNNELKVIATNLEMSIETTIEAEIKEKGAIVLPAKYFVEIVRKLEEGFLKLTTDEKKWQAHLQSGLFAMTIHGFDPNEFPSIIQINNDNILNLNQSLLKKMIEQTCFAVSNDESRPFLTGVLLNIQNELNLVATDGHRLALKNNNEINASPMSAIIPAKALNEVARFLKIDKNITARINWNDKQISFSLNNICLITRLIEGQFPNYKQLIPSSYTTEVIINKYELNNALERASLIVRGESNIIKLKISTNNLIISSNAPEVGDSNEEINCTVEGDDLQIAFNFKYILEALKVIEEEEVIFKFTGNLSPGIIHGLNESSYIYVIMPVRSH